MFSKNQTVRYRIINQCLRNPSKKYWSKQELLKEFLKADIKVNERTVDYDIEKMRNNDQLKYNAPIAYSKYNNGYYYTNPDYSIENLPLTETDFQSLKFASAILNHYRNSGIFNDFSATVEKIINLVSYSKQHSSYKFIEFEKSTFSPGAEHLNSLISIIQNKKVIQIEYKRFEDEPKKHTVSPYLLKEYRSRWYLLGLNHITNNIITLGLDRIVNITPLEEGHFWADSDFNSESYFKHTFGITYVNSPAEEIILSFEPYQGHYLRTQPLHNSQEILVDDEDEFRIKLHLVPNYELYSTILSYGSNVEVISPVSVQEKIIEMLQESTRLYKKYTN